MTTPPPRAGQLVRLDDDLDPASPVRVLTDDGAEHSIVTAESSPTGAMTVHVEPTPQAHQRATLTSRILGTSSMRSPSDGCSATALPCCASVWGR